MIKNYLKKHGKSKRKIKRKEKKTINKKQKKIFRKTLKRKSLKRKLNKSRKYNNKRKIIKGGTGGQNCSETFIANNQLNLWWCNNKCRPYDYYQRIYQSVENNEDVKKTFKHFIFHFVQSLETVNVANLAEEPGKDIFINRINAVLNTSSVRHNPLHIALLPPHENKTDEVELPDNFNPYTYGNDKETVGIRIFNLIMHELDRLTCHISWDQSRAIDTDQFLDIKAELTNMKNITSINGFIAEFHSLRDSYKLIDLPKGVGIGIDKQKYKKKRFKYGELIRRALGKMGNNQPLSEQFD